MAEWLPELSDDDLATLMEALKAWENNDDSAADFMSDLMDAALVAKQSGKMPDVEDVRRSCELKRERKKAVREERSVLLRAKLLTLRDRRRVEQVVVDPRD